MFRTQIVLS